MFNRPRYRFQILKGEAQGRTVPISHSPFTLGSDPDGDMVLPDASVRPQHAVLEQEGQAGPWTLRNAGGRGVLVNQQSVSSAVLQDGDLIQIGAATLLGFHVTGVAARKPTTGATTRRAVHPALLAMLGVVTTLALAFLILAPRPGQSDQDDPNALTPTLLTTVLQGTRDCLLSDDLLNGYSRPMARFDASSEPATRFYVLIALRQRDTDAAKVTEWVDQQMLGPVRQQFTQAWLLETQGRLTEARQSYGRIAEALPDLRCPATRYAAFRQGMLTEQIAARQKRA